MTAVLLHKMKLDSLLPLLAGAGMAFAARPGRLLPRSSGESLAPRQSGPNYPPNIIDTPVRLSIFPHISQGPDNWAD